MFRNLESIINNEALEFALYSVQERAIPNMIDGLKPVQRFVLYRALEMGKGDKSKFHKVASIAGSVSDAGYNHGEVSAQESGKLMANDWNNNIPFLAGRGNFGSRLVQDGAASRYIYAKIHDNFYNIYSDFNILPEHEDLEHKPPKFYLPSIPTVLLNGVTGIATGYATSILPHSIGSVIKSTMQAVNGVCVEEPEVEFPLFNGKIEKSDKGVVLYGKYEVLGKKKIYISEVPYKYDRATYIDKVLDKLKDDDIITSYDDNCRGNEFGFGVNLKNNVDTYKKEDIEKLFGLTEKRSQFIVVVDENGKLRDDFDNPSDLIKHFVKVRLGFIEKRIEKTLEELYSKLNLAVARMEFIKMILEGSIEINTKTKTSYIKEILSNNEKTKNYIDKLLDMAIYNLTEERYNMLKEQIVDLENDIDYWENTTPKFQYLEELDKLSECYGIN